jgi:integrase
MLLEEVLTTQFFRLKTGIRSEKTRCHYLRAVRWLGELLGHPAKVDELTDDNLAGLLQWLQSYRGVAASTANGSHKCLCCLWRWCRDRDLPVRGGPTVAKLQTPRRIPRALREDELTRLIAAAHASPGSICGMPARTWWLTLLALEMDTGARAKELLSMRWEMVDWNDGTITVPAEVRKGSHHDERYGFLPDTLAWLERVKRPEGLILQWDRDPSRYYQLWSDLLERAGLPTGRAWKTQCLRRTFATLVERGGQARSFYAETAKVEKVAKIVSENVAKESRPVFEYVGRFHKASCAKVLHSTLNSGR